MTEENPTNHLFEQFHRFFQDPCINDDYFRLGVSSIVCSNLRVALRNLGYEINNGDKYDAELAQIVLQFQIDNNHKNRDGIFGPGTRKLLLNQLAKVVKNASLFQHVNLDEQFLKHLLDYYQKLLAVHEIHIAEIKRLIFESDVFMPTNLQIEVNEVYTSAKVCIQKITELEGLLLLKKLDL